MKQGILDPTTGELVSPDKIKVIAGNREDLQQAFMKDNAGLASQIRPGKHGYRTINGGSMLEFYENKIKGITEDEWKQKFANNPQLVEQYMNQMPELAKAIEASGQNPKEYLAKELSILSRQLVGGTEEDLQHTVNPLWKEDTEGNHNATGKSSNPLQISPINLPTATPLALAIDKFLLLLTNQTQHHY